MLTAKLFGTSIYRDAWVIAWSVQIIIFKLLFGPINEIFRSKFAAIKQLEGDEKALQSVVALLFLLSGICLLVVFLFYLFKHYLVAFFAPGYTHPSDIRLIEQMLLYLIPTLFFSELVTIFVSLLNSYKSFYLPEIFGLFSILFNIILLLCIGQKFGIYTLVIANYGSQIVFVLLLLYYLVQKKIIPQFRNISLAKASPFLLFGLPLYLTYFAGQLNAWAERFLVSFFSVGGTSSLDYARKFIDMPITIIMSIGATVMTPMLATIWANKGKSTDFAQGYYTYLRLALVVISPIVFLFSICSSDLVLLLLNRGHFDEKWLVPTAQTLKWFGLGLYGVVFYVISGQSLLVQGRSNLYAIIGVCAQLIPILINVLFFKKYGLPIFGFSWCCSQLLCGMALFMFLKNKEQKLFFSMLTLALILVFNLALGYVFAQLLQFLPIFWKLISVFSLYCIGVVLAFKMFKLEEYQTLKRILTFS